MSGFWQYFAETLRWPLGHAPGPVQALLRGLAANMDATREDALYLREQFFPAKAESTVLPAHGDSRGIIRHTQETDAQFRARVVHAWRWHMLGGKTLGLPEILAHYGVGVAGITNRREINPGCWAEFEIRLAEVESSTAMMELLAQLPMLVWVLNEYKPARSVLARIYNHTYDERYWVWSKRSQFSKHIWSDETGIRDPESGLIISLGQKASALAGPLSPKVLAGRTDSAGALARLIRFWVWSHSRWSDVFPLRHSFSSGQVSGAEAMRAAAPFRFRSRTVARGQMVWSGADFDTKKGQWSDINARWGLGSFRLTDNPARWSATRWSDDIGVRLVTPLERFVRTGQSRAFYLGTVEIGGGTGQKSGRIAALYPHNFWRGPWNLPQHRPWNPYLIPSKSTAQRKTCFVWGKTAFCNAVWQ